MATLEMQTTAELAESRRKMQAKRRTKNRIALTLSMATMVFGLFWLVWILLSTISRGFDGMSLALFTEMTPPPNTAGGGLANALAGSALLIFWATAVGTPLGIMAGIYLAEYGRKSILAEIIRNFRIDFPAGVARPQVVARLTLRPRHGFPLVLIAR